MQTFLLLVLVGLAWCAVGIAWTLRRIHALRGMLDRFAPDEDGLGEAEIACAARARAAIARAEGRSDA